MQTLKFVIEEATLNDVPALAELVNSAYRGESSKAGWTTEADLLGGQRTDRDSLEKEILTPDQKVLLLKPAAQSREISACVLLKKLGDSTAYLGMLTVNPQQQASGIGRELLFRAEQFARDWNCQKIKMTVIAQRSELIAWYERRGYHRTGAQERFPYGDERFGIPRREDLYFVVLEKKL